MKSIKPAFGISTLVNHVAEGDSEKNAHVTPIFQTSTFRFPDVATGAARFKGEEEGYIYTRYANPNTDQLAEKIAYLEGLDLLRAQPDRPASELVAGMLFASGMSAISSAILACVKGGDTVITQEPLYGATYSFFFEIAPIYGINVIWVQDPTPENWQAALEAHPEAKLVYAETPVNPTMDIVDLAALSEIAHRHGAWLMVDNTFASPYCQRPLTLGADVVVHSTTKYLSGHGLVIGGAVVSSHVSYIKKDLFKILKLFGGCPSPYDAWLANIGLKTFELRMERHCSNAMQTARFLENHPAVEKVFYPGLESHRGHALAAKQMLDFGGMMSFELKGGFDAGVSLMEKVKLITLAVSLGNVDSLIQHPASMSHSNTSREARLKMGLTDGLVRFSIGVENVEDIIADLDQALKR
jgi:methionine-gamma-lyase